MLDVGEEGLLAVFLLGALFVLVLPLVLILVAALVLILALTLHTNTSFRSAEFRGYSYQRRGVLYKRPAKTSCDAKAPGA